MNNNNELIEKKKFFPLWSEEKELAWLSEMSENGWHLKGKDLMSYWFEKGEASEYEYRYDYKLTSDEDFEEFIRLFGSNGWELVLSFSNWNYFRSRKNSRHGDIKGDEATKKARLKGLMMLMIFLAVINTIILANYFFVILLVSSISELPFYIYAVWALTLLVVVLLIFGASKIGKRLKKLKTAYSEQ